MGRDDECGCNVTGTPPLAVQTASKRGVWDVGSGVCMLLVALLLWDDGP